MQILIVEDEKRLADVLGQLCREQRWQADVVYTGTDGLAYARSGQYDAVVLDVMLPGMDGFGVVRTLRREKVATPVLMLTARDDVRDKVTGLDCGADDYMTKPFQPEELLARLRALTRRRGEVALEQLAWQDLTLDLTNYELRCGERKVRLGFKEFEVLRLLLEHPGMVCPRRRCSPGYGAPRATPRTTTPRRTSAFCAKSCIFWAAGWGSPRCARWATGWR